ncbi:hypothetical protein ACQ1Q5_00130 [Ornithobacterium rhinotracheale]
MNVNIITRKVQLNINQENVSEVYKTLYDWFDIVFKSANLVSSHLFFLEEWNKFNYLTEEAYLNLSNKLGKMMKNHYSKHLKEIALIEF